MATAAAVPDQPFLCATPAPGRAYHPDGVELTYAAVRAEVLRLKDAYAEAGYGHGHRIALLFENRPEFFFHYLAANALGAGVVPVNPDYRHDELAYQMDHSGADLAVSVPERVGTLEAVARERAKPLPVLDVSAWPASLPRPGLAPRRGAPGPHTECGLLYTSGTTGRPKGCVLSNFYYLNAGAWYRALGGRLAIEPGRERFLNPLPLFHMNCQAVTATCAILTGNCLILPERFSPRRWWPDVAATRATIIHYLGVMPPLLLNQAPVPEETTHRVKAGLGAGVEPELHEAFERRFGFPLVEVWGMTETGRIFSDCHEPRSIHTRAFGRPHGGLEARVVDDQGREVPRETEGEQLARWPRSRCSRCRTRSARRRSWPAWSRCRAWCRAPGWPSASPTTAWSASPTSRHPAGCSSWSDCPPPAPRRSRRPRSSPGARTRAPAPGSSTSVGARSAAESARAGPSAHALQSTAWLFPNGLHVWPRSCVAAS